MEQGKMFVEKLPYGFRIRYGKTGLGIVDYNDFFNPEKEIREFGKIPIKNIPFFRNFLIQLSENNIGIDPYDREFIKRLNGENIVKIRQDFIE